MIKKQLFLNSLLLALPISFVVFWPETFRLCQNSFEGFCAQQNNFFWIAIFWASFYYTLSFFLINTFSKRIPTFWFWLTVAYIIVGILIYILNFNLWTPGSEFFDTFNLINTLGFIYLAATAFITLFRRNK